MEASKNTRKGSVGGRVVKTPARVSTRNSFIERDIGIRSVQNTAPSLSLSAETNDDIVEIQLSNSKANNNFSNSWPDTGDSAHVLNDDLLIEWSQVPDEFHHNNLLSPLSDPHPIDASTFIDQAILDTADEFSLIEPYLKGGIILEPMESSGEHFTEYENMVLEPCGATRLSSTSLAAPDLSQHDVSRRHDCTKLAKSTLDILCLRSTDGTRATSTAVDTALRNNATAIKDVLTLLSCTCNQDPYLPFALTVIISKMIAWYHSVGRADTSKTDLGHFAAVEELVHVPLTLGTYEPDPEYVMQARLQLVQQDLRKVKPLIVQFENRFCSKGPGDISQDIGVYSALLSFLKSRLKETEEELESWKSETLIS